MKLAVISGWVARALVIVLSLVNSRLLIELVGVNGLAVQSILVSLATWFALLNFGIPSAVQNLISRYRAENKDYERLKQTACNLTMFLLVILSPVAVGLGVVIKYYVLSRYPDVTTSTVVIFCGGLLVAGMSALFNQILYAEQRGHWPNLYPALNAICVTLCLLATRQANVHNINLVLLVFVLANLLVAGAGAMQADVFRSRCLDKAICHEILRDCRGFALFAILAASVLGIDYLIMSRILSAQDIAVYNICQRVFMALFSVHAIILTSAWPGVSEALFTKQWESARERVKNVLFAGGGIVVVLGVFVMIFMGKIAGIISQHRIASVHATLAFLFLVYLLLRVWSDTYAMALMSFNATTVLNRYVPFQAALSIVAQITLGRIYGTIGIMLGLIISFTATAAWILPRAFYSLTRRNP